LNFFKAFAAQFPSLKQKLVQARMEDEPEYYLQKTANTSMIVAATICFMVFGFTKSSVAFFIAPIIFIITFTYLARYVDVKIIRMNKEIAQEIIFAGRFLIIELESDVPLYDSFINLSKNYSAVGPFFGEIVQKVNIGTTMESAIDEAINSTPSPELRKILWQVLTSMKTGADVADSLNSAIDQIVRQQQIDVKEYGRKLNPMAMFYMMVAVIIPSLGTTMIIVLSTFVGFTLPLSFLLVFAFLIGFVQFMFLSVIKSSRPPMEL
jgi:archaeal flagellar protein FlaJ